MACKLRQAPARVAAEVDPNSGRVALPQMQMCFGSLSGTRLNNALLPSQRH